MINLVESIQKNLGYPLLHKVSPNTQDIAEKEKHFGTNSLAQAAIPAVLCGLFNYVLQRESDTVPELPDNSKWLPLIFGNRETDIIEHVAVYAGVSVTTAKGEMEHIADEAVRLLKKDILMNDDMSELRKFSIVHKNDALLYLPASLHIGELLGNNNLDDNTHKMEGPISSLMHSFEKHFSGDGK